MIDGPTSSFHALFGERQLYTFDPKAIHYMLVKDDKSYDEPPMLLRLLLLIFGPNVMSTTLGHQHRKQRKILNPAFSLAHMKDLTPTIFEIGHKLQTTLTNKVKDQPQEIDILSWMGRTALEMIGQGGLGYSFDSMAEQEKPHPFAEDMKRLFPILARLGWAQIFILPYAVRFGTTKLRKYIAERFPWKDFQEARAISNSMWEMSKSIYEDRKRTLSDTGTLESGKDVLSLMIRENLKASGDERLEEEEMIGQSALTRMLEVLAQHPEAQHKLRGELSQAFEHGDPSYDDLVALPYLDSVIRESLRMYPSVSKISRTTTQDTILPLSVPVQAKDGTIITEIPIMKNTEIQISIMNMNRNPNIWGADADTTGNQRGG
ncbi:hypothetical protein VNI00_010159 [Paramarasmius palmivorus]|uniref:Cytochrome P450 n=1 Tax=Paramarasmius palmivorus TaxID=297713 RepID=A0AAW0CJV8_9AGAR